MLTSAFFWTFGKKSRRKNSKLKPKAQKAGTSFKTLRFLCEKLQVLLEEHEKNMSKLKEKLQTQGENSKSWHF